ncbi:ABC transporter permease [Porphyromonas pogonae]|uniref:ABC transporter permease n=1 Tax=Porphyromonas pogonae TaxID=867595 RepID=UPI002E7679DB|nr:ABC transporter permease [Porphyromonas pogonae]
MLLRNYLVVGIRNIVRHKRISFINILGLTIGIASSLLMLTVLLYEWSYDRQHSQGEKIFRVESTFTESGGLQEHWASSSFGYGAAMKTHLPGITDYTRVATIYAPEQIVRHDNIKYRLKGIAYADSSFFTIFDGYKLIDGDKHDALSAANKVVISQSVAKTFFPGTHPVGQKLELSTPYNHLECEVTGVMEDFPANSHLHLDILISYPSLPEYAREYWYKHEVYTYVKLDNPRSKKAIEAGFPVMAEQYKTEDALKNKRWGVILTPLRDIHLNKALAYESESKGSRSSQWGIFIAAISIMFIIWVNYVNLAIAQSIRRSKEVGIRKVLGSGKGNISRQFIVEYALVFGVSLLLSIILLFIGTPFFSLLVHHAVSPLIWVRYPGAIVAYLIFIFSGSYVASRLPVLRINSVDPISLVKGVFGFSASGKALRKALITAQFVIAFVLLAFSLGMLSQLRYMQHTPAGIRTKKMIAVKFPGVTESMADKLRMFKDDMNSIPGITHSSLSGSVPGEEIGLFLSNRLRDDMDKQNRLYEMLPCDEDYLSTYDIRMLEGRFFSRDYPTDKDKLVINECAMEMLNIHDPHEAIGKQVIVEGVAEPMEIIGVTHNFHQQGLAKDYTPMMFIHEKKIDWLPLKYISIAYKDDVSVKLNLIKNAWQRLFPQSTFDYFFVSDYYDLQYQSTRSYIGVMIAFSLMAILISCLGLWGLIYFELGVKRKELGIRKVFGAGHTDLISVMTVPMMKFVFIAVVVGIIPAYYVLHQWLSLYAFHISISWWHFVVPIVVMMCISFLTLLSQVYRVIVNSPVISLKTE